MNPASEMTQQTLAIRVVLSFNWSPIEIQILALWHEVGLVWFGKSPTGA